MQWQVANRRPAMTDSIQSMLSVIGDHATAQVVRYNSGVASLNPKWWYRSGRSQTFHPVRGIALLGIDAHRGIWTLLSPPWKLFLTTHLLSSLRQWELLVKLLLAAPWVVPDFSASCWSSLSSSCAPTSVPLLLSLVFLGTFLTTSSGWQGRHYSWDIMD